MVMVEVSAVLPEDRFSINGLRIWKDEHIPMLQRLASFIHSQGVVAGRIVRELKTDRNVYCWTRFR
jgi:2,4-dienoyl-CoA reductase-like NADH-dependent reductase (Old Yellow Enzyme family)